MNNTFIEKYIETNMNNIIKKDFLNELNIKHTPKDLLKYMKDFDYGWVKNEKYHSTLNTTYDFKNYLLMQPDQVYKYKSGLCQDQALFEYYILTNWGYDCNLYFIQQFKISTHTYLVYKKDDKLFHFENSFYSYRGLHGPYNNSKQIARDIYNAMISIDVKKQYDKKDSSFGYLFKKIDVNKILGKYNITWSKFLDIVGYDYEK